MAVSRNKSRTQIFFSPKICFFQEKTAFCSQEKPRVKSPGSLAVINYNPFENLGKIQENTRFVRRFSLSQQNLAVSQEKPRLFVNQMKGFAEKTLETRYFLNIKALKPRENGKNCQNFKKNCEKITSFKKNFMFLAKTPAKAFESQRIRNKKSTSLQISARHLVFPSAKTKRAEKPRKTLISPHKNQENSDFSQLLPWVPSCCNNLSTSLSFTS